MNEEIYPNAPIVLMVAEIKHTEHGPLDEKQSRTISEAVRETLPIREEDAEQNITFTGITDGTQPPVQVSQTKVLRWSSRDRRTVLTVKSDTISVETTQYHRYMDIRGTTGASAGRARRHDVLGRRHAHRPEVHRRDPRAVRR